MKKNQQIQSTKFALLFLILLNFSCSRYKNTGELNIINILEAEKSDLNISEIADNITYIPLASDSVLATIMNVVYFDGDYFVKDNKSKFLRFNKDGNLLNKIGRRGQGPGEYRFVSDFVIFPETREIFITGGKRDKIMVYSPEGHFIRSFDLTRKSVRSIGTSDKNILVFFLAGAEHDTINMQLINANGTVLKNYPNKYEFMRGRAMVGFSGECVMYGFNNQLHFKEIFSDTVFTIDGQNIVPKMMLNSEDKSFTPEMRTKAIEELSADPRNPSESLLKSVIQSNLFETGNFLFYSYGYNKKGRMMIYNKSTGKKVEIDEREGIKNDWDGGPNIQLKMNKEDNTVFSWINAFELKTYVASEEFKNFTPKYPEKKKELEKLANSLDENDNPVLMLVKLK